MFDHYPVSHFRMRYIHPIQTVRRDPTSWFAVLMVIFGITIQAQSTSQTQEERSDRQHWAFAPLEVNSPTFLSIRPSNPSSVTDVSVTDVSVIDRLITRPLERNVLRPKKPFADRESLAKRASLAITGQLPDPLVMRRFVQATSGNAYESYVDQLLASKQVGEWTATAWLNLLKGSHSPNDNDDRNLELSQFRDWLISAINEDLPYDQWIQWQLAGDLFPNATNQQRLASTF